MDSRERVWRAVERTGPDRPPRDLWLLPATRPALGPGLDALLARWPRDIANCGFAQYAGGEGIFRRGQTTDHWGSVWSNEQDGLLGIVTGYPLSDDDAIADWQPPFAAIAPAVANLPAAIAASGPMFRLGGGLELFHRMCWLRPMEQLLADLLLAPDLFGAILDKVSLYFDQLLEEFLRLDLDAVLIVDDWGSQRQLFIPPDEWRRWFKPHYARWAARCRSAGKLCFMHSDGYIMDILPDLDEMGIAALNAEVDCMGLQSVIAARGRICLWGEVDRQNLLPRGTPEEVTAAAHRYLELAAAPEGGCILQGEIGPDVPLANVEALFKPWGLEPAS